MAEDIKKSLKNDDENLINRIDEEEEPGNFMNAEEPDPYTDPDKQQLKSRTKMQFKAFKWHWVAVFAVAVIVIYLSLLNGVSIESALTRALYCTAIFWIIAEVVDWVIHKMN